ncbi:MAG: potassium channel protein, partial [Cyanobacteria bacterium]|nr:potassium channel protein [Cyanobacteriota bacterium]
MSWPRGWLARWRRPPSSRSRLPWLPVLALGGLVNLAASLYRVTEGWDWGDCYWMVLITLSTLGFSDPHTNILTAAGRVVTAFLIAGGLVVVQLTIRSLLGLAESGYFRRLRDRRLRRWIKRMNNHVILCGYGRIGREIAEQLNREGVRLLVIETDQACKEAAEERGLSVLLADATLDETLMEAGIQHCRSLVAALSSNASNLYVVLSARGLAPDCRLIARADSEEAARKLRLAGADQVVSPYVAGGRTMAATALRPLAVSFMELLAGSECEVEEFQLSSDPQRLGELQGASLEDLHLRRRSGALVLAVRNPKGEVMEGQSLIANPGGHVRLEPGQLLVVMGSQEQLSRLR